MGRMTTILAIAAGVSLAVAAGMCGAQKPVIGLEMKGVTGTAVQTSNHQSGGIPPASAGSESPLDGLSSPFPDTGKQKRNDDRQRRIVIDTQKLLALTAQLKAEVAASGAETMTPEMLKQMDEIEKLAKSVKEKMRN